MPIVAATQRFTLIGVSADQRLARFGRDVAAGLTASPKHLSCCYFYDRLGSLLFEAICEVPEYYLTRAETAIFQAHAEEMADLFPAATDLIELGSGNALKTRLLLEAFLRRHSSQRYLPLDICRTVLEDSSQELLRAYPALEIVAIAAEYHEGLKHLERAADRRKLILWLGSNIGNLERPASAAFMARVRAILNGEDRVLIGFDLRKDRATLEAAYNDPCGVTAAFNRNLLVRINRELGGHFDVAAFRHQAVYNDERGRIEMYLVSDADQEVAIDQIDLQVSFRAGETIHTENSYKYSTAEIEVLAGSAGLRSERSWLDPEGKFQVTLLGAR